MKTTTLGPHIGAWVGVRAIYKMGFKVVEMQQNGESTLRDLDQDEYLWEGMILQYDGKRFELFLYNPKHREFFIEKVGSLELAS